MATRPEATAVAPATAVAAAINDGKTHLLLAASGSVATVKLPSIINALKDYPNLSIRVILTKAAAHFLGGQSSEQPTIAALAALPNVDAVHQDEDEWVAPWTRGAEILHIELRRWAHLLVVAPMSANLLAKITGGLCDNLLTNTIRAWDVAASDQKAASILVAPAMNDRMFSHPLTATQLSILGGWPWFEILPAQVKLLACGDLGQGGMCDWNEIVRVIETRLAATDTSQPRENA
ncbi:hypothetical protein V496_00823 [Pseudogymnoascus sp. VKM F-4515 (FW-2607)]|nr:hypothetical protein V496_00823 [Pseudogymnoascus sp. VKM F-4515 (FW-2607)]KFY97225.1 hypothetical protein V498_02187 [Pseudogymnoascus sp. VKM F-4517 (FW-2822)]